MSQQLVAAITDMREADALKLTSELLDGGANPLDILRACRKAMEVVGERFETGNAFIPELIFAGVILSQISDVLKPVLEEGAEVTEKLGKIVIGTVEGDIHDIAKDIVAFMLEINGFDVLDLGVDVPPARFVAATKEFGASIVALSGFLTLAFDPMKATVIALREAGLDDVKVMIGGGQIDERVREYTGADAFGHDAMMAVTLAKQWVGC
jgi:5-methyltetrahydrofolate--homocysteine methyltransferase